MEVLRLVLALSQQLTAALGAALHFGRLAVESLLEELLVYGEKLARLRQLIGHLLVLAYHLANKGGRLKIVRVR